MKIQRPKTPQVKSGARQAYGSGSGAKRIGEVKSGHFHAASDVPFGGPTTGFLPGPQAKTPKRKRMY